MIKVRCPIVVEGRYDRMRLADVVDGIVLETGGFRIYRDREMLSALRQMAETTGLILLTDSDRAGFQIRNYLKNVLGKNAKLIQVYIPAVAGVEKRKHSPSTEGLLGVEGMPQAVLEEALCRAGVTCETVEYRADLTRADLFDAGLIGHADSAARRRRLLAALSLPPRISAKILLEILNMRLTREEFQVAVHSLDSPLQAKQIGLPDGRGKP